MFILSLNTILFIVVHDERKEPLFIFTPLEIVNVPVILAGGIRDQEDIKNIIQNSYIKFFGLSRPFDTDKKYLLEFKEININF